MPSVNQSRINIDCCCHDYIYRIIDSLRAQFAVEGNEVNPLHGSDNSETAAREIQYFFPVEHTVGIIKPSGLTEKGQLYIIMLYIGSILVFCTIS